MEIIDSQNGEPALAIELSQHFSYVNRKDLPKEVVAKLHSSVQGLLVTKKLAAEYALLKKAEATPRAKSH